MNSVVFPSDFKFPLSPKPLFIGVESGPVVEIVEHGVFGGTIILGGVKHAVEVHMVSVATGPGCFSTSCVADEDKRFWSIYLKITLVDTLGLNTNADSAPPWGRGGAGGGCRGEERPPRIT